MHFRELSLREQLPPGGILVRHDHQLPTAVLEQPHAVDRTREELKLVRRPNVPGPSAVDHAVSIEEYGRTVRTGRTRSRAMTLHLQGGPGFTRLKEEVDEGPFRERIAGEDERLVDGEPRNILDFVRFQAERFGIEVALVDEPERVRRLAREPGDVDVQEAVEGDVHPDLLFRLALHSDLGALAVVHESAGDVPIAFREPADRFDHQHPRPYREDDFRDASDHGGVDRSLHEGVDVTPLENRVSTEPLVRMVIEERLLPYHAVIAEVHHAIGLGRKWERLTDAGEPERATIANEVDLAVRLDEDVVAA